MRGPAAATPAASPPGCSGAAPCGHDRHPQPSRTAGIRSVGRPTCETIHAILDAERICHVAFVVDGWPYAVPTIHARDGDRLLIHGSTLSRMLGGLAGGVPVCVTVTAVDGIVCARSAFNHSMNYRSAMVFGTRHPDRRPARRSSPRCAPSSSTCCPGAGPRCARPSPPSCAPPRSWRSRSTGPPPRCATPARSTPPPTSSSRVWSGVLPIETRFGGAGDGRRRRRRPAPAGQRGGSARRQSALTLTARVRRSRRRWLVSTCARRAPSISSAVRSSSRLSASRSTSL